MCNGIGSLRAQHRLDRRTSVTIHVRSNKLCFIKFPKHLQGLTHTRTHTLNTAVLSEVHREALLDAWGPSCFFFSPNALYLTGLNPPMTRWYTTAQTTQAENHGSVFRVKYQLWMTFSKDPSVKKSHWYSTGLHQTVLDRLCGRQGQNPTLLPQGLQ